VLLEVNCETDFVAKGDAFIRLANELAMVAASCDAVCVSIDEVPAEILAKEREVRWGQEQNRVVGLRALCIGDSMVHMTRNAGESICSEICMLL
jgi:translation elongation factor EF-Ts